MRIRVSLLLLVGMEFAIRRPLGAERSDVPGDDSTQLSERLEKNEQKLEKMQADRHRDKAHAALAQEEFRKGTDEISGYDAQLSDDIQDLKKVEGQVTAGKKHTTAAQLTYKDAAQKYGSADGKTTSAKQNLKESRQAMPPLLQSRRDLKKTIQEGGRRRHNAKTVLSIQKRMLESDARYGAIGDRKIKNKEKSIAADRREIAQNAVLPAKP